MPKNKDFAQRIEIIDECLRNHLRKWTLELLVDTVNRKLADKYGKSISKRSIQEDLKYLREEKDAPIEKKKDGAKTYFLYSDANFSIKNLPIENDEIERLNDVIRILKQVNDFKILPEVEEIVNKLQNTVKTNVLGAPSIIQFEKHTIAQGSDYIDDIFNAIKESLPLRISYQSFKAEAAEECIYHPYLLKEYRNRWFLIGRKSDYDSMTILALDRIKAIKNSNELFIANNLFNTETYFNNMIGITMPKDAEVETIEIKVNQSQAPYIRTKPIHQLQEIIKEYKDGSIKICLRLIINYELKSVLLSYGADIEIMKPISLRDELKTIFQNAMSTYQ